MPSQLGICHKSSNQGQEVGHAIDLPLYVYIVKANQRQYSSKNWPEKKYLASCTTKQYGLPSVKVFS